MASFLYMLVFCAVGVNHLAWQSQPHETDPETEAMIKHIDYLRKVDNRPSNNSNVQWFL